MGTRRIGPGVLMAIVAAVTLLVLDYWVVTGSYWLTERAGWSFVLVVVPAFLAALGVGWIVGRRLIGRRLGFVVWWSIGFFLVLRIAYTVGGWFHGDWFAHLFGVVLLPLAPVLGYWLGARWAQRRVESRSE